LVSFACTIVGEYLCTLSSEGDDYNNIYIYIYICNSGIYEMVKLRRMGLCYRINHRSFLNRFAVCTPNFKEFLVVPRAMTEEETGKKCRALIGKIEGLPDQSWQVGKTKVFLNESLVRRILYHTSTCP
jgi:myosin heavy subunit